MRFPRYDPQTTLFVQPPEPFRDDRLREQVDSLPDEQRHMISRVFFGGAFVNEAAEEIGVKAPVGRQILEDAIGALRALQEED